MKIVIDIPDICYDWIKNGFPDDADKEFLISAIRSGTPLPKGYGDLIDRDELLTHTKCCCRVENCSGACEGCSDNCVEIKDIERTPIIIPADKENKK